MAYTAPPWVMAVVGSVLLLVLTGGTALYVRSEADLIVESHDTDSASHADMHSALRADQAMVINRQTHFQGAIDHLKENQDDMKALMRANQADTRAWLRAIDEKIDRALTN